MTLPNSRVRLLMQKRPGFGPVALLAHIAIVIVLSLWYRKWCPYSHSELEIDGICYSSTTGSGVRKAQLDTTGKDWRAYDAPHIDPDEALARFRVIEHQGYDWLGAVWWALPFARHRLGRWSCFEATAKMAGMEDAHKQGPFELIAFVQNGRVTA